MPGTFKLTIPVKCFIAGLIPFIIMTILDYFELLNLHGGPGTLFLMIITITAPPICFIGGIIEARKLNDTHRRVGFSLNILGLLIFWYLGIGGWPMN